MNNTSTATIRKAAAVCALLAATPLLLQMPSTMVLCLLGILLLSFILPSAPNRFVVILVLFATLALMLLEYRGGFGRDVAACMLALMMGLKCLETKSIRDLRSVLGFSLFLPFAALLNNQSPLSLSLSLLSVLCWLFLVQACSTGTLRWPKIPVLQSIKRMAGHLLFALPIAAALFWLFPRISTPLWGLPNLSSQGMGLGDSMKPGQWLDSLADDRIAFRVKFTGTTPTAHQRYWRGPVLWDFNGIEWTRRDVDSIAKSNGDASDKPAGISIGYQVSLEPTERKYLPALDWPQTAPTDYYLSQEQTVYSDKPIQKITQYSGQAYLQPQVTAALDFATRQRALAYPLGFNKRTQALAKQWRAQSQNERAYIERVMQWIERDFSYTLATEEPGINAVDEFLFTDKKGFCQHFSSSFAILMRAAGIPTRIVTGYVGGYKNPYGDYWMLYQKDAHAWNEVWLENEGWVRFDPTAAVAPENILDTIQTNVGAEQYFGEKGLFSPIFDYSDFIKSNWNDWVVGFNAARQENLFKGIGIQQIQRWQLLILLIVLSSALSYVLFLFFNRKANVRVAPIEAAWLSLLATFERKGFAKHAHETALDFALRFIDKAAWSNDLLDISQRYTNSRYANATLSELDIRQLIEDMRALGKQIQSSPRA
jgi:protein-glutamine gamma-glutamyltransferase